MLLVVGKSTPENTRGFGYYGGKKIPHHGLFGDCKCVPHDYPCPRLWFPQQNRKINACPAHWINVPQRHTELEEITNWQTSTVEEIHRTPFETWNVHQTPVETIETLQRNQYGPKPKVEKKVYKKSVYGAKKKTSSLYTKKTKSYKKPVKRYRTKVVITYRRVRVEQKQCCPPLKFWFFDYPAFTDTADTGERPTVTDRFTK